MKKYVVFLTLLLFIGIFLNSCGKNPERKRGSDASASETEKAVSPEIFYSNMSGTKAQEEVRSALKAALPEENVDAFMNWVKEYNEVVKNKGLTRGFEEAKDPEYDVEALDKMWTSKKGEFIGTNCRLNTYMLLKDSIQVEKGKIDDSLLFFDIESIEFAELFDARDKELFLSLFSKVKTEPTKDIKVHATKMKNHFSKVNFNEKARMISVIIHDNLDGDYLFIGHTGVLVEHGDKYLFVEKVSFQEPYQAIKFDTKQNCYEYLYNKYKYYCDPSTAKPFIMDNANLIELELYNSD